MNQNIILFDARLSVEPIAINRLSKASLIMEQINILNEDYYFLSRMPVKNNTKCPCCIERNGPAMPPRRRRRRKTRNPYKSLSGTEGGARSPPPPKSEKKKRKFACKKKKKCILVPHEKIQRLVFLFVLWIRSWSL